MPGTLIGAFVVDWLGPKYTMVSPHIGVARPIADCPAHIQITGLLCQAVIGFIMSGLYTQYVPFARFLSALFPHDLYTFSLKNHIAAFAVVYGIFLSFGELGPGNCLGMLAAKSGPTAVRGQFYGAAAAIGKVGAFVGTWAFPPIIEGTLWVSRICIDYR